MGKEVIIVRIENDETIINSSESIPDYVNEQLIQELKKKFGNDYRTWYDVKILNISVENSSHFRGRICYIELEVYLNEEMIEIMKEVGERLKVGL